MSLFLWHRPEFSPICVFACNLTSRRPACHPFGSTLHVKCIFISFLMIMRISCISSPSYCYEISNRNMSLFCHLIHVLVGHTEYLFCFFCFPDWISCCRRRRRRVFVLIAGASASVASELSHCKSPSNGSFAVHCVVRFSSLIWSIFIAPSPVSKNYTRPGPHEKQLWVPVDWQKPPNIPHYKPGSLSWSI